MERPLEFLTERSSSKRRESKVVELFIHRITYLLDLRKYSELVRSHYFTFLYWAFVLGRNRVVLLSEDIGTLSNFECELNMIIMFFQVIFLSY